MIKRRPRPDHEERLAELEARARRQHRRILQLEQELLRLSPQAAAFEARLADLEERSRPDVTPGEPAEQEEARALVTEVRQEHARVRARISAAVVFEERLRVVEAELGLSAPSPES